MLRYTLHRLLMMIPTLFVISLLIFFIIQLPPGDFLETYIAELQARGESIDGGQVQFLRETYGLDQPFHLQYLKWAGGLLQGNLGYSFEFERPVAEVVGDRVWLTILVAVSTIIFTYLVAFPIGIYSAVRQYSFGDYVFSLLGFLGLAIPNFLFALVLMYFASVTFGSTIGGLMASEYLDQPWSWGKVRSVLTHIWVPILVIGTAGTAQMIRLLRANMLDELQKQYVVTARAKGLPEWKVVAKYPLRLAVNPFIANIGSILPQVISGSAIVAFVLDLNTTGPMLINALKSQDMYLAGSFLMILSLLVVIGVFLSDLALAALDPRIRLTGGATK
ncbi:MAG: ABC transporter permease [Rhodovibrionaceae bacterium]